MRSLEPFGLSHLMGFGSPQILWSPHLTAPNGSTEPVISPPSMGSPQPMPTPEPVGYEQHVVSGMGTARAACEWCRIGTSMGPERLHKRSAATARRYGGGRRPSQPITPLRGARNSNYPPCAMWNAHNFVQIGPLSDVSVADRRIKKIPPNTT